MRTCLSSLKSNFDKNLKSNVVYEIFCDGYESIYVGQSCRHVTTRMNSAWIPAATLKN